ncbi:hypothetical protein BD324DRAFT_643669 [Kockovaella imperatae]|uniref:Nudix hydrolase domain-containing protein n=1 Tax=Kockovaella imperatae TaxID=4999 RepID=A0A1Y1U7I2_9TREE|nr:hypothetical protein BD324DRAFT_643669 [Kockovaella imperatae]ORX33990.1 hypothetical protein BD324DRAFT_643669 [Kockovaella imperatae]
MQYEPLSDPLLPGQVLPPWARDKLSAESKECISRLLAHEPSPTRDCGMVKQSAVLVALFQPEGCDELRVLLTTRAKTMRTHPNQTALPGGRVDQEDHSPVHTAYREANEEVGLPLPPHPHIHHLTVLDPLITILPLNAALRNHIIVIPVICFISDQRLISSLVPSPSEVGHIFSHRLKSCHSGIVPENEFASLAEKDGEWWPHPEDMHSQDNRLGVMGPYRMHRFRTTHSPIKGVTSDVLINTATLAYGTPPSFTRFAPGQLSSEQVIERVVAELPLALAKESALSPEERTGLKALPLEWGNLESGERVKSGETWHDRV